MLVLLLGIALLPAQSVIAQQSTRASDAWQFGASIYGWFPDIAGETVFMKPDGSSDFKIDIEDILDNLEFTLMGTLDVRKGRWGLFTDLIYMDVGGSETGTREASIGRRELPDNATADVDLDLKSWIWTLTGYYRAIDQPGLTLDVLAGTRYVDVEQEVNWNITGNVESIPVSDRTGAAKEDLKNWDAIIGLKGRFALGAQKSWFVPYYLDVGTGESDFTFQGIAGLGYAFRWVEIVAAWRYLYYDLPSGGAVKDISFNGPAIGIAFRW
jgi:hypothetical protein